MQQHKKRDRLGRPAAWLDQPTPASEAIAAIDAAIEVAWRSQHENSL